MTLADDVRRLLNLTSKDNQPNINELWLLLRDYQAIKYSIKQEGYRLGRVVFDQIRSTPVPIEADPLLLLASKPSTQQDIESPWFRYWCAALHLAPVPHRKLWEYAYVLQNAFALGKLAPGTRALGFGCGTEPIPSLLARRGVAVTVTDLAPEEVVGKGWAETGQHLASLDAAFDPRIVARNVFDDLVSIKYTDMNAIPRSLDGQYDLCWSICALEHLGSIKAGTEFILNSLRCLRPGGVAIYTTEFNYSRVSETVDNWPTVLFLQRHFEELAEVVRQQGFEVLPFEFDVGHQPLDCFVDLPPYAWDGDAAEDTRQTFDASDGYEPGHLKLSIDGFPSTCFGLTIRT